ncbi:MAG TPA: hypothetical protein VJY15_25880 [Candidatus Acidoferrum sp.]|nr:hypothetical protein [Candidatus Acidoferrum sp.]
MAQKTCDAKPYLAARTPIGMMKRGDGGLELKSCHDPSAAQRQKAPLLRSG